MEDPRRFATGHDVDARVVALYRLADRSLAAATSQEADACDREIGAMLGAMIAPDDAPLLASVFANAPTPDVYRHLWRALARSERELASIRRRFAIPVVIVAAAERAELATATVSGVIDDVHLLVSLMHEGRALARNASFALANTLASAGALSYDRLGRLLAEDEDRAEALPPAPIVVQGTAESVHLRFIVGTAIAAPGADLFRDREPGAWGLPFARALSRMLAVPRVSVLALPRAPLPLVTAAWQGAVAQREVGAQVFASNAIRAIRARVGEPSAVVSVHRDAADPRAGEVRLSLSSPLEPRQAVGFRCALLPLDRVDDVVAMLESLLADCRVADVRRLPGIDLH
jgi:hypothetical protein